LQNLFIQRLFLKDILFLRMCFGLITEKLHWESDIRWTNYHFEKVSESILVECRISISSRTIRRIYSVASEEESLYKPQEESKSILVRFLGYKDWDQFKAQNLNKLPESSSKPEKFISLSQRTFFGFSSITSINRRVFIIVVIALCLIGFFLIKKQNINMQKATLSLAVQNNVGFPPLTSTFNYRMSEVTSEPVLIDFGDCTVVRLPFDKEMVTNSYLVPGYYRVTIKQGTKVLAESGVQVLTKDWETGINIPYSNSKSQNKIPDHYFSAKKVYLQKEGKLYLSPSEVKRMGFDTLHTYWTKYRYITDMNCEADNCSVEARVKNGSNTGGISCFDFALDIQGEKGTIRLHFTEPGCTGNVHFIFSEQEKHGRFAELSAFGQDLSDWTNVALKIIDRKATVFVKGKKIYENKYNQHIGKIKGVVITFRGSGALDNIKVKDLNNQEVYSNVF